MLYGQQIDAPARNRWSRRRVGAATAFGAHTVARAVVAVMAFDIETLARAADRGDATIGDLQNAVQRMTPFAEIATYVWWCAVAAVVSWSFVTVRHALRRGLGRTLNPWIAALGWLVPVGNLALPWRQLRRAASAGDPRGPRSLVWWQGSFAVMSVLEVVTTIQLVMLRDSTDASDAFGLLHSLLTWSALQALTLAFAGIIGIVAMRDVESAIVDFG